MVHQGPAAEDSTRNQADPDVGGQRGRRRAATGDAPAPPGPGRRNARVTLPPPALSAAARAESAQRATIVEDEFFRQLAGGALADDQPPAGGAAPGSRDAARRTGSPGRTPAVGGNGPCERWSWRPRRGLPRASGAGWAARAGAVAAFAIAGVTLVAVLVGSNGDERSVRHGGHGRDERGRPNGRPAAADARLSVGWPGAPGREKRELSARWRRGDRVLIAGRLTSARGQPISGARLSVLAADGSRREQGSRTVGEVRTDRLGRFAAAIALDRGAPRKLLTFAYRARSQDNVPATTARAQLEVLGTISARTPTRRTRPGRSVPLEGRSPPGATVQLLVRQPDLRLWRLHSSVQASRTGRWEASFFVPSYGPRGTYHLRTRVLGSQRRGFLSVASHPISVRVR